MQENTRRLFESIGSVVCEKPIDPAAFNGITEQDWTAIFAAAKEHELAHLTAEAVLRLRLSSDEAFIKECQTLRYKAMSHYIKRNAALKTCRRILAEAGIPFLPLKGSVICQLYPQPWVRSSSDIDILTSAEHYDEAVQLLQNHSGFKRSIATPHDISFDMKEGVRLELHHSLIESGRIGTAERPLEKIWDYTVRCDDAEYMLKDEMFYYYHLAHMAKHIERGGCGIRPFIDLWILNHKLPQNPEREKLLQSGGLIRFAEAATRLSEYWFGDVKPDDDLLLFEKFILEGGVFGSKDNEVKIKSANLHGKAGYMLNKIWMPYPYLCCQYPSLKGKKALLPLFEVRRWSRIIFKGNVRYGTDELKRVVRLSDEMEDAETLWRYLGF